MKEDFLLNFFRNERVSILQELYKTREVIPNYSRFGDIKLDTSLKINKSLEESIAKRVTGRSFSKKPLSFRCISALLHWSAGTKAGTHKRFFPSGGSKFPIELYVIALNIEDLDRGAYRYNFENESLEHLPLANISSFLSRIEATREKFVLGAGAIIMFSFVKSKSMPKYGALAYKLALLEAGHMSQNFYLVSTALNLSCCAMGMVYSNELNEHIGVNAESEPFLFAIGVGAPSTDIR